MKSLKVLLSIAVVVVAMPLLAADAYHAGQYANCSDCHTMHASVHDNVSSLTVQTDAPASPVTAGGTGVNIWLPVQGDAEHYLLKGGEAVCETCHDGKTFAPDVIGANNGMATAVRSAGYLDGAGGHQLGSKITPPGFDTNTVGVADSTKIYVPANGLECVSCHGAHGSTTVYRQLVPYSWPSRTSFQPTRNVSTTFDATKDVNINKANFVPGTADYYDASNISYGKFATAVVGQSSTNNRFDTFCAACHGQFHGGATGQGTTATTLDTNGNVFDDAAKLFVRHPTAGVVMGTSNAQVYDGTSTRYPAGYKATWQKAPLYLPAANDFANATPGCVSCHKAHGNNNPFGLLYIGDGALTENGSVNGTYVSLCHQCHAMGGF